MATHKKTTTTSHWELGSDGQWQERDRVVVEEEYEDEITVFPTPPTYPDPVQPWHPTPSWPYRRWEPGIYPPQPQIWC